MKLFAPESGADSCIIVYVVLKCFAKVTLRSKGRLVPVTLIEYSSIFFPAIAFAMSTHRYKDSTSALNSDTVIFRCHKNDSTLCIACEWEVTSNKDRNAASKVFKNFVWIRFSIIRAT